MVIVIIWVMVWVMMGSVLTFRLLVRVVGTAFMQMVAEFSINLLTVLVEQGGTTALMKITHWETYMQIQTLCRGSSR